MTPRQQACVERRAQIAELYRSGRSVTAVAAEVGVSTSWVYEVLSEDGIACRAARPRDRAARNQAIVARFQAGHTLKEIGIAFGIGHVAVHYILKRAGLNRSHGGQWVRTRAQSVEARAA